MKILIILSLIVVIFTKRRGDTYKCITINVNKDIDDLIIDLSSKTIDKELDDETSTVMLCSKSKKWRFNIERGENQLYAECSVEKFTRLLKIDCVNVVKEDKFKLRNGINPEIDIN